MTISTGPRDLEMNILPQDHSVPQDLIPTAGTTSISPALSHEHSLSSRARSRASFETDASSISNSTVAPRVPRVPAAQPIPDEDPRRKEGTFNRRQVQMLSICKKYFTHFANRFSGVSIGSGLLFESGIMLAIGGPVSLFLSYVLMSTVLYAFTVPPKC
jgi:amino acid permease